MMYSIDMLKNATLKLRTLVIVNHNLKARRKCQKQKEINHVKSF